LLMLMLEASWQGLLVLNVVFSLLLHLI